MLHKLRIRLGDPLRVDGAGFLGYLMMEEYIKLSQIFHLQYSHTQSEISIKVVAYTHVPLHLHIYTVAARVCELLNLKRELVVGRQ